MSKTLANLVVVSALLLGASASSDPQATITTTGSAPKPTLISAKPLAATSAPKPTLFRAEAPAVTGGRPETYGGGGGCPYGGSWAGRGNYCIGNSLYYCSVEADSTPRLVERCVTGCRHNPPGVPDQCRTGQRPGNFCYSDYQCGRGQVCSRGVCVDRGHSTCHSNYQCALHQVCRNGQCVSSGGEGQYCRRNRDCRVGDVCLLGQCQPVFPGNGGGYCNSCQNTGCGFGERCVHEGNDYSCNGTCRPAGGNGGRRCHHNNDCSFGSVCLLGQCQAVLPGAGTCNSCANTGCGFGEQCVKEGNDYSCNGVCRRGGQGGSGGRRCSANSDCGFGALCLFGSCRNVL